MSKPKPAERRRLRQRQRQGSRATGPIKVNPERLAPDGSYSQPDFLRRGHYIDQPFTCVDCDTTQIWRATQQLWWYEVAKGGIWTTALRCRACRAKERRRRDEARTVHLDGVARRRSAAAQ